MSSLYDAQETQSHADNTQEQPASEHQVTYRNRYWNKAHPWFWWSRLEPMPCILHRRLIPAMKGLQVRLGVPGMMCPFSSSKAHQNCQTAPEALETGKC